MKISLKLNNCIPYIIIKYEGKEWETIENKLVKLGLKKFTTENGFGLGLRLEYYRESNEELKQYLLNHINGESDVFNIIDNINGYVFANNTFNIAIFRVIPNNNNEVNIQLDKYITISELRDFVNLLTKLYKYLFEIITNAEIKINFKEKVVKYDF